MKIIAILNNGEFRVHAAGCADVARETKRGGSSGLPLPLDHATFEEVARDLNSDFIAEGSMDEDGMFDGIDFLPCCAKGGLVEEAAKESSTNSEKVVDDSATVAYTVVVSETNTEGQEPAMNASTATIESLTAVQLRKLAASLGIKGASRGKKSDLIPAIQAKQEAAKVEAAKPVKKTSKKAKPAKTDTTTPVRSGTAKKFIEAAKAAGWTVDTIDNGVNDEGKVVFTVRAASGAGPEAIELRWIGGAYDYYQGGSFHTDENGKSRKILNASQAHRYL